MPKQSGIYKLKGKLDGLSYYRQSGVDSQLVRRINTAMSDRVKTSDEFANTRRNNVEFGGAADVAKLLGAAVQPKFRPMLLNFSQSKLTKDILEMVKASTGDWGQRAVTAANTEDMFAALSSLAKLSFDSNFGLTETSEGTGDNLTNVGVATPSDLVNNLIALGADGVVFKAQAFQLLSGKYSSTTGKIEGGRLVSIDTQTQDAELSLGNELDIQFEDLACRVAGIIPPPSYVEHNLVVVVAMPYRTINSKNYTLQEYCSFIALKPAIA